MDSIWQAYGYNGDSLWVWGFETSQYPDSMVIDFQMLHGASFPGFSTIGQDSILSLFGVTYTPQYVVICPDKSMKKVALDIIEGRINSCEPLTDIYEVEDKNPLIYFNNSGVLKIEKLDFKGVFDVAIYDITGKTIFFKNFEDKNEVSVSALEKNNFLIVKIIGSEKIITGKVFSSTGF
ncbi:MAG: T9SS type A sorting domain-containing protein [Bacteroidales bacterium]|nr:T9SS type A sorting domain-containing protein [Bacteroidales bacterium]